MANEPPHSPHGEAGYGENAEGVLGEQQHRPGMSGKVKHTLTNVKDKIKGQKGEHSPGSKYCDDPQRYVGHPSVVYGNMGNGSGSGGEKAHHRRPLSPRSPRSPHVAVGHNPEFEPVGVGEQAADAVMPGHHLDHHSDANQSRAEKFLEKVPGYAQNPYKHYDHVPVGPSADGHEHHHHHPSPLRDPERQHVVGEPGSEHIGEDHVERGGKRPGFVSKLKDLVTGQKPGHGAVTGHATTDQITETKNEHATNPGDSANLDGSQPYTQKPTPLPDVDCFGNVKQKIRVGGHQDTQSQQPWPSPKKPDYHNMPGAVYTDDQGKPIEGPKEEGKSPKTEGVMSKIMEKLHIGQQKPASDHAATSPATRTAPEATTTNQ